MELKVTLKPAGHAAKFTGMQENRFTLSSPKAYPPGAPCTVVCTIKNEPFQFDARTLGSKKKNENEFEVTLRFVSLPKTIRQTLEAFFA